MNKQTSLYKRHRYPPDIIQYAVWLYYRLNLSHRDIEDLLAERGITVSRESIRLWCHPWQSDARGRATQEQLRRPRPSVATGACFRPPRAEKAIALESRSNSSIVQPLYVGLHEPRRNNFVVSPFYRQSVKEAS